VPDVERVDDETRKRKHFFFEKKQQKTFMNLDPGW
jgi:hypothetical protein